MITDVRGKEVKVGDTVAFAGGGRGASEFFFGEVVKVTTKGVKIKYKVQPTQWDRKTSEWVPAGFYNEHESQRNSGMFAILESV